MRSFTRPFMAAAVAVLALGTAACGSSTHPAAPVEIVPTHIAASPVGHPAANAPALTQQQLQNAAVITSDVAAQQMGVLPLTDDSSPLSQNDQKVTPAACQSLADAWQGGGPDYRSDGAVDLKVMEGNSGQSNVSHLIHLSSYTSATATRLLNSMAAEIGSCSSYDLPDSSGPIHEAVTPASSPQFGDQSVAWHVVLTGTGGQHFISTVTVVRVGGAVISAVELSDSSSSPDQLPGTNSTLMNAQISKLAHTEAS